jgi:hypothetical protein
MYIVNNRGDKTAPCGRPARWGRDEERAPSMTTVNVRSER